jgi:signal transduction histidine kinase
VLERIVNIARDLVDARYAALAVAGPPGTLVQFKVSGMSEEEVARIEHLPQGKGLLGYLLIPEAKPIRMSDLGEHPFAAGFPEGHPVMTSFLGVPIISRGELLGSLYLTDKQGADEFSTEDERLIEMLSAHAAVAIENARLYQQVRRLAVLEERERIGMDLHDGIIQSIYAVGLTLEYAALQLDEDLGEATEKLGAAIGGLNAIIKDIRNYILDLRPQKFRGTNLEQALRNLLQEFRANTLAEIRIEYDKSIDGTLDQELASVIFHIAQEALANAAKHAVATRLSVSVQEQNSSEVVLRVRDNGRGFDVAEVEQVTGHGLSNMELRARAVGGHIRYESNIGEGTTVWAFLPRNQSDQP